MIRTRPDLKEMIAGDGEYIIAVTQEQLQLIAAYCGLTTLGLNRPFREAAADLMQTIVDAMDDEDFLQDSLELIQPTVTIHDSNTWSPLETYDAFSLNV